MQKGPAYSSSFQQLCTPAPLRAGKLKIWKCRFHQQGPSGRLIFTYNQANFYSQCHSNSQEKNQISVAYVVHFPMQEE